MNTCPRCQRPHSGLCGIPPGVTKGYGAHVNASDRVASPKRAVAKAHRRERGRDVLQDWRLDQLRDECRQLEAKMKSLPLESDEVLKLDFEVSEILEEIKKLLDLRGR